MTHSVDNPGRRKLLQGSLLGIAAASVGIRSRESRAEADAKDSIGIPAYPGKRPWLGPQFWSNRCQDWQLNNGRIECLRGNSGDEVRTVSLITREIVAGQSDCTIEFTTGLLTGSGKNGFAGLCLGIGSGKLDYRGAAIAQRGSGKGGGIVASWNTDGSIAFRDYTSESDPLAYAPLDAEAIVSSGVPLAPDATYRIVLTIKPDDGNFMLSMSVFSGDSLIAQSRLDDVAEENILGGVSLVSSPATGVDGSRWWFSDIRTSGAKLSVDDTRAVGPILGSLYSLSDRVLKMSAQLMPVGELDAQEVTLERRLHGSSDRWRRAGRARIMPGYSALLRVEGWDSSRDWDYRIAYRLHGEAVSYYEGMVRKDPEDKPELVISLHSCVMPTSRQLADDPGRKEMPQARFVGRYTPENILHPHTDLIRNTLQHDPDVVVFVGDQFYEHKPAQFETGPDIYLDMLYRWYLWMWAFRDLTRDRPALILTDDHDVYHGNLWGNGGRAAPDGDQNKGGYVYPADFVHMVHRTQCSHNPDAFDPTPIDQGINVYYGAHAYGGVSLALIEDRKFKTAPIQGLDLDPHVAVFLGERQERFLRAWKDMHPGMPKVCITQSVWASVQTSPEGEPIMDFDSNGYPPLARTNALRLVDDAGAVILAGDQHLATLVRHGIDDFDDGPVQFTGPAMASFWQRWFEHEGRFTDAFGNKVSVLAVANPKLTFAEYRKHIKGRYQGLDDRSLKSEGYGVCRVDKKNRQFHFECWEWNEDPGQAGATQFDGWPHAIGFDEVVKIT